MIMGTASGERDLEARAKCLRSLVEAPERANQVIVFDVLSGDYAIDKSGLNAAERLRAIHPDAATVHTRTGRFAAEEICRVLAVTRGCTSLDDVFARIEAKHRFQVPAEYTRMVHAGWAYVGSPNYLWISEMEWMSPVEILAHAPQDYHLPEFVPFAFTGAGDHWCWWPQESPSAVVYCPHDSMTGEFDAASTFASVFRRILEAIWDEDTQDLLAGYAERFRAFFPDEWCDALLQIASEVSSPSFSADEARDQLIATYLTFDRMGEEFLWMRR